MNSDPNDVVKVYAGPMVTVEIYQQVLADAGIQGRVVGEDLTASFGSAIPDSVELWVHRSDLEKATAAIQRYEDGRTDEDRQRHRHPTSDRKPGAAPRRKEPHVKQDPLGE
jgi:hypothetical protein